MAKDLVHCADAEPDRLDEAMLLVVVHHVGARGTGGILAGAAALWIYQERGRRLRDVLARLATPAGLELELMY